MIFPSNVFDEFDQIIQNILNNPDKYNIKTYRDQNNNFTSTFTNEDNSEEYTFTMTDKNFVDSDKNNQNNSEKFLQNQRKKISLNLTKEEQAILAKLHKIFENEDGTGLVQGGDIPHSKNPSKTSKILETNKSNQFNKFNTSLKNKINKNTSQQKSNQKLPKPCKSGLEDLNIPSNCGLPLNEKTHNYNSVSSSQHSTFQLPHQNLTEIYTHLNSFNAANNQDKKQQNIEQPTASKGSKQNLQSNQNQQTNKTNKSNTILKEQYTPFFKNFTIKDILNNIFNSTNNNTNSTINNDKLILAKQQLYRTFKEYLYELIQNKELIDSTFTEEMFNSTFDSFEKTILSMVKLIK